MKRVLIVDDDTWQADHFERILQNASYKTVVAHDALQALAEIDAKKPDVLLLDYMLPGANAMTLLHELRSYDDTIEIPVVLCTNIATAVSPAFLKEYGIGKVLDKSLLEKDSVIDAVREVTT